ncbi:MAG: MBL fold metallo-hydrolase [Thermoprotei archaeon]
MEKVSKLRVTILSDNFTSTIIPPLVGEWGFSAFIEADGVGILYDVGNSGVPLLHNAELLGIDLKRDVDYIVLSHGHSDHTGGLGNPRVRELLRGKVVIAHPSVFEKKLLSWRGRLDYIGIPLTREEMEREFRLILTREPLTFAKGVTFGGEVKSYGFPRYTKGLYKGLAEGVVQDDLPDDSPLYINTAKGLVIITGCGHSGILNIVRHAREVTGEDKIYAVLGGFHLLSSPKEHVDEVMKELEGVAEKIGPAHCSGFQARLTRKFVDMGVGGVLEVE